MECVEGWTVNHSRLVPNEHSPAVFKRVDNDCSGIAQTDLENGLIVPAPPFLADRGVVIAQLKEMANYWACMRNFGNAFDLGNIRQGRPLR